MRTDVRLAIGAALIMAALVVAGFKCGGDTAPPLPADSVTVTDSVLAKLPLAPVGGRLTLKPATGQAGVQVSADSAGQVGATLGPALSPVTSASGVRFQLFKAGSTWRWRLIVTASGRVLATSYETYTTRAADSTAARTVARVAPTAPVGT